MSFSTDLREELLELKMWDGSSNLPQDEQIARLCIREAFIKSGFFNDPNKEYHLEIMFKSKKKAEEMINLLESFNIHPKLANKNSGVIVYIKEGEEISSFLALIGASKTVIKFEEIRVEKEMRNNINRIVNCETANLNKTISAAVKQIEDIRFLKSKNKFKDLPDNLKEIAKIRLENPDISYEELGQMLSKPIGKSGVSHRLRKISEIAEELRK
ncbi:MAG: DNA-binding protein WhiA [Clostridiales bacterium]|nr:DNA-binding protein WhiA [Clostridiales bacterium]